MYVRNFTWLKSLWLASLLLCFSLPLSASEAKPFAEHHVVLQISDDDPNTQTLVLNVASNLLNHYGQDKIDVEIVAFNRGLRLLFEDNDEAERIASLSGSGVRFAACENTMTGMSRVLGHEPVLNPKATRVPAGVVRILELVDEGYVLIRP